MRDRFGIFGAVIRIIKLNLLLVVTLRMPNNMVLMNEHDDAYVDAMLMVIMQANTSSVTIVSSHFN